MEGTMTASVIGVVKNDENGKAAARKRLLIVSLHIS